ncbi:hypothetical protein VZT92_020574 [Zoarces viviparus]|uniref:Secreted protein n=1 Tax=Zoarces viviparus TaxID=48416 RepID=A0AAW1EEP8_ZOAVI
MRAPARALGIWRRGAPDGRSVACCCCLLIPGGSVHHGPPPSNGGKKSGIPSVLGRGCCASGPDSVPGTITRRRAPLDLSLSRCPHTGNNHTG